MGRASRGEVYFGLKSAIAIAQQHAGVVGPIICSDDVESAIAIHIAHGYGPWIRACGESCLSAKGAIAITQEYADGVDGRK